MFFLKKYGIELLLPHINYLLRKLTGNIIDQYVLFFWKQNTETFFTKRLWQSSNPPRKFGQPVPFTFDRTISVEIQRILSNLNSGKEME